MPNPYDSNQDGWDVESYNDAIIEQRIEKHRLQWEADKAELREKHPKLYYPLIGIVLVILFIKSIPFRVQYGWIHCMIAFYKSWNYILRRNNDKKNH